ncbi:site-specific integrase [bacterium]|nr:MAG: site-specific integrase [bacterium]
MMRKTPQTINASTEEVGASPISLEKERRDLEALKKEIKKKNPDHAGCYFEEIRKGKLHFCWRISIGVRGDVKQLTRRDQTAKGLGVRVRALIGELNANNMKVGDKQKIKVQDRMNAWLETKVATSREDTTYRSYKQTFVNYIDPVVGHLQVENLQSTHLMQIVMFVRGKGLAEGTARYAVDVLLMGLGSKIKTKLLDDDNLELPSRNAVRERWLSKAEISEVLGELFRIRTVAEKKVKGVVVRPARQEFTHRDRFLIGVILSTGVRINEALGITMDRIDLRAGTLTIDRQLKWRKNKKGARIGWDLGKLKTKASNRVLPLNAEAIELIRAQIAMVRSEADEMGQGYAMNGLLFPTGTGAPTDARNAFRTLECVNKAINKARKMVDGEASKDMPHFGLHDLRRSYLTQLAMNEPTLVLVMMLAGHSNMATTQKHYVYADQARAAEAAKKISFGLPSFELTKV